MEGTNQITQAIQSFLEGMDANNLQAVRIVFEEKSHEASIAMTCGWEWDPSIRELVWVCRP